MEARPEYAHVACMFFCTLGADLYAQLAIIGEISASELRRKFIRSPLLVGQISPQKSGNFFLKYPLLHFQDGLLALQRFVPQ